MHPACITLTPFSVTGIEVRTINRDEFNPATAKLPRLWQQFYQDNVAARIAAAPAAPIFGVYAGYESDATGHYTVTAGMAITPTPDGPFNTVEIAAGEYLVFTEKGTMPQAVITAWTRVWQYFEASPDIKRCFHTDFELYASADEVAVHIGIES